MRDLEPIGWMLFTISGLFFLVVGIRDGDPLVICGVVAWLIGCAIFMTMSRR